MDLVIETHGLTKKFKGNPHEALRDVSFSARRASVFGFIGPNGAGKTTTIRILLGLLRPSGGTAKLFGTPTDRLDWQTKSRVACMLENRGLFEDLSVIENLTIWSKIFRMEAQDFKRRLDQILSILNLEARASDIVGTLSGGMRAKLALARAVLTGPDLLILDEPTNGLDPIFQREIQDLIKILPSRGTTVFLSSHNLPEVQDVCSDLAVIDAGRIIVCDSVARLLSRFEGHKKSIRVNGKGTQEEISTRFSDGHGLVRCNTGNGEITLLFSHQVTNDWIKQILQQVDIQCVQVDDSTVSLADAFRVLVQTCQGEGVKKWDALLKTS